MTTTARRWVGLLVAGAVLVLAACGGSTDVERVVILKPRAVPVAETTAVAESLRSLRPGIEIIDPGLIDDAQLDATIDELLADPPSVIVSVTSVVAIAVAARDLDIPHVFTAVNDPVGSGLVDDLRRPGGSTTGIGGNPHNAKAVEHLVTVTGASVLGILVDRGDPGSVAGVALATAAAGVLGVVAIEVEVTIDGEPDQDARLELEVPSEVEAVVLPASSRLTPHLDQIAAAPALHGLPLAVASTGADPGLALLIVEIDTDRRVRSTVAIIDAILDGEDPGLIPVAVPETRLVLNAVMAQQLGLEFPPALLVLADDVIR